MKVEGWEVSQTAEGPYVGIRCEAQGNMVIAGEEASMVYAQRWHDAREIHAVMELEVL